jgi:hypothetical protein
MVCSCTWQLHLPGFLIKVLIALLAFLLLLVVTCSRCHHDPPGQCHDQAGSTDSCVEAVQLISHASADWAGTSRHCSSSSSSRGHGSDVCSVIWGQWRFCATLSRRCRVYWEGVAAGGSESCCIVICLQLIGPDKSYTLSCSLFL